ncbi:hypothetical protein D8674_003627 [Pyrus ussuriensis x Pyrus communis]|uniref:Uncharacterized protein n=1 Tax=Pyrus ussuriensis x Pyrus communis TaxID=2448454 RepID=A0A5N5FN35_9ROSA|nr:hypothetical protein D8674_003627 [Pyrus ussuriensis x Pyrus communis]
MGTMTMVSVSICDESGGRAWSCKGTQLVRLRMAKEKIGEESERNYRVRKGRGGGFDERLLVTERESGEKTRKRDMASHIPETLAE